MSKRQPTAFDAISEQDWTRQVIAGAQRLGWRVAHFHTARAAITPRNPWGWATPVAGDGAGFPDLVMVRGERIVVAGETRDYVVLVDDAGQ